MMKKACLNGTEKIIITYLLIYSIAGFYPTVSHLDLQYQAEEMIISKSFHHLGIFNNSSK